MYLLKSSKIPVANVTESHPRADCGGAASMGQIGNDVSSFLQIILFSRFSILSARSVPAWLRFRGRMRLSLLPPFFLFFLFFFLFLFFSPGNSERRKIDRLFGLLRVITVYTPSYPRAHRHLPCTCMVSDPRGACVLQPCDSWRANRVIKLTRDEKY